VEAQREVAYWIDPANCTCEPRATPRSWTRHSEPPRTTEHHDKEAATSIAHSVRCPVRAGPVSSHN